MKKYSALVLAVVCVLGLVGCNSKSMNDIIENEPSVRGIVTEVHSDYVMMYSDTAEGYPNGSEWQIPLDVENKDSYTDLAVGDEIVVYHDGNVMETDPLKVDKVYAITLEAPAIISGENDTVQFHEKVFSKSDLSQETIEWLAWYNGLSESEQLSISSLPSDLYELCGYEEAEPQPTKPVEQPVTEPSDEDPVKVLDYIPTIYVELKYATEDNFTGKVIYDFSDAYLRYGTVKKLMEVQAELIEQGYSLKIWDAYRPVSAQFTLWETCPDPVYVANPNNGYSSHSKGNTVDVTLVKSDGTEITMPTGFDDFSDLADRDYSDVSDEAAVNAMLLENTMSAHGFTCYSGEWWHFSDTAAYSVLEN